MLKLVLAGLANASTEPVLAAAAAGAKPFACPLVRADASRGEPMTANLRHEPVELDALAQHVLPLLDGSRDVDEVKATILQRLSEGRLVSSRNDVDGDPNAQTRRIADSVDGLFSRFARGGLLRVDDKRCCTSNGAASYTKHIQTQAGYFPAWRAPFSNRAARRDNAVRRPARAKNAERRPYFPICPIAFATTSPAEWRAGLLLLRGRRV
jgi:hypothetical protein